MTHNFIARVYGNYFKVVLKFEAFI